MIDDEIIPETESLAQLLTELLDDPREKRLLELISLDYDGPEILDKLLSEFGGR